MILPFFFPSPLSLGLRVRKRRRTSGEVSPPPDSDSFSDPEFERISLSSQANLPQARIAHSSSKNAVTFSSACTTKRFPSPCASTIQIVRPSRSRAETQPKIYLSHQVPIAPSQIIELCIVQLF